MKDRYFEFSFSDAISKIFKYSIIYIVFEVYFVGLYISQKDWIGKMKHFKEEYSITGQASTFFGASLVGVL